MKKANIWIISSIIFLLILLGTNITTTKADVSDADGLAAAPSGVTIGDALSNSSLFVQGSNTLPATIDNNRVIEVIQNNPTQVSSVWSNKEQDNYFDTGNKQTLSMWVYLGGSSSGSEGMAFVLQNSGYSAIAKDGNSIAGGETLGVWGSDLQRKATTAAMAGSAIQNSWALEFDSNGSGLGSSDVYNGSGGTLGQTLDSYQIGTDDSGNTPARSLPAQHLAWAYPGYSGSYTQIGKKGTTPYYELNHNGIEENTFSSPSTPAMAWHHLLITYTPPTAADPTVATLRYDLNDKTIDGRVNTGATGQHLQSGTVNLKLSRLGVTKGDPLYYGFTAANSVGHTTTNAVVFETLPSLVNAYGNAYVVDETNQTKVSSSTDVMTTADKALAETTTVHPNDKLRLNYMLNYDSGNQDMKPITASIDLPDNVTITKDSDGNIGKVVYKNGDTEEIPYSDINGSKLTYTLKESLNVDNPWSNIELNATANQVPDASSALQVPLSHATLEGDNYKTDVQTPPFLIQEARDNLTLTKTSKDPVTTSQNKTVNLTGTMKFDKQTTVDNSDINFNVSIDGKTETINDTDSANGSFSIPFSSSDIGKHTITVQAIDPNYVSSDGVKDTIASNTLTYTVNISDKALQIASDSPSDLVAVGNTDLSIDATDNYNDDSDFKNSDMTLHTVINGTETTTKLTGDDTITSGKFTVNIPANLIEANKTNTVDVYLTDGSTTPLKSNTLSYNVTVPDTALNLSTEKTDIQTFVKDNATLTGELSYADAETEFKNSDMTLHVNVDGTDQATEKLTGETNAATNSFEKVFAGSDLGVGKHTITLYVTDVHGRKSNSQEYSVDVIDKELSMESKTEYDFQFIRSTDKAQTISRQSDWGVTVNSTNSTWTLTANSSSLVDSSGNTFNGELTFTNNIGDTSSLQAGPVLIAKDTTASATSETTDVSGNWPKNQGVLLHVNSGLVNRGKYNGTIYWNLSDTI
ncbi:hypothetical protein ACFQAV_01030 [Companilactobacillus huachuanensis]|uniref:WxL domain-containing protein n=1 Tax=Companilactobacillus huachuanensis TaxID=2559914 RepID=A0ABW1RLT7_9LACO|nr:hypothetical protein [Companilactobacillus huachuanensis]